MEPGNLFLTTRAALSHGHWRTFATGVCYIGLVFKRTNNADDETEACCGAQMFLHTGEGIVFKGSVGPWQSEKRGEFHLSKEKAAEIVNLCAKSYKEWHGEYPRELFIHGRTRFKP